MNQTDQMELVEKAGIKLCQIGIKLIQEERDMALSRGGRNTVYHNCDIYQGRPNYAACLMVMDQAFDGVNRELRPQCHDAIANRTCPALAMRKAELQAGRALFFVDYTELRERRQVQWALDEQNSPVQFRRRDGGGGRFKPTVMSAEDLAKVEARMENQVKEEPVRKTEVTDDDYNLNIMEQVAKKVLNDN